MRSVPSNRSAISIAASRSAVPLHCNSSVPTTNPWRFLVAAIFSLKALLTRPRLDQGSIYAEVLIREQIGCTRLVQHFGEELRCHVARQQPVAVLAVDRGHPDRLIHIQTHEPAEQQVVAQLFHQEPFAANAIQDLEKQSLQQLLRRDGRSA